MKDRALSLDALRGYAILTMVLSAQIAFGILPSWMYHAQVPPPLGVFNPEVLGITWVDLVFPFFLFAMGAAFPFSVGRKAAEGVSKWRLTFSALERGVKLTFFAIYIQHLYPWVISNPQDTMSWILSIVGFLLLFPMFMRIPGNLTKGLRIAIEVAAYVAALSLMLGIDYYKERAFDYSSNIIILVLANMAFFGTVVYILTINNRWARLGVLPFIMAILIGGSTEGSWVSAVLGYSPAPWIYQFRFLKYLFIVIPGTIAGEYLVQWLKDKREFGMTENESSDKVKTICVLILSLGIIILNLWGLFSRQLVLNLFLNIGVISLMAFLLQSFTPNMRFWRKMYLAGSYLLMLGLFFEAYEGGIRKDPSTFSYYFVTAGLAFFALIAFSIICDVYKCRAVSYPLEMTGKNPMLAYVVSSMFIAPVFFLTGIADYIHYLEQDPWLGFLRGILLTGLAMLITIFFTKIKWLWRT